VSQFASQFLKALKDDKVVTQTVTRKTYN